MGAVVGAIVGAVVGAVEGPRARGDGFSGRAPTTARPSRLFARSSFDWAEGSDQSTGCNGCDGCDGCTDCNGCDGCDGCTDSTCGAADGMAVDETSVTRGPTMSADEPDSSAS